MLNLDSNPKEFDYKNVFKQFLNPKRGADISTQTISGTKKCNEQSMSRS